MAEKYTVIKHKVKKLDEQGNPIKNEKGNFVWETVEKKYRVDGGFKPTSIDEICADFIDNYNRWPIILCDAFFFSHYDNYIIIFSQNQRKSG